MNLTYVSYDKYITFEYDTLDDEGTAHLSFPTPTK